MVMFVDLQIQKLFKTFDLIYLVITSKKVKNQSCSSSLVSTSNGEDNVPTPVFKLKLKMLVRNIVCKIIAIFNDN